MWILKNSKDLLEYIQSRSLSSCNSIKIFDLSTLYTTIPHFKLNNKLRELVQLCFIKKNDIFNRLQFLIDNIFVMFGGRLFQQSVGIPMGTNCAHLLADLFLYSYEVDFIQGLLKRNEKKLALSFNFTFRYIDDVLSLNNSRLDDLFIASIPLSLKLRIPHTLTCNTRSTMRVGWEGNITTKEMI
jgi:hypothetical protein